MKLQIIIITIISALIVSCSTESVDITGKWEERLDYKFSESIDSIAVTGITEYNADGTFFAYLKEVEIPCNKMDVESISLTKLHMSGTWNLSGDRLIRHIVDLNGSMTVNPSGEKHPLGLSMIPEHEQLTADYVLNMSNDKFETFDSEGIHTKHRRIK